MKVDIHKHQDPFESHSASKHLDCIERKIDRLIEEVCKMALDISKLQASLQKETDAEVAVENLLTTLTAAIKAIPPSTDPKTQAALDAISTQMDANNSALAAAVVANTPAA